MEAVSSEENLEQLLKSMMNIIIENSGAQRGLFLLGDNSEELLVVAEGNVDKMQVETLRMIPISSYVSYPQTVINYVVRTKEAVILKDSLADPTFNTEPYFVANKVKSVLCTPIVRNKELKGLVYLENNLMKDAFSDLRKKAVDLIATQMSINLENAKFSQLFESEKRYRVLVTELEFAKKRLEEFIDTLCHELRNPLNGIYGNQGIMLGLVGTIKEALKTAGIHDQVFHSAIEEMEEVLNAVSLSADHLKDIVDTVLNTSRLEKQDELQVDLFDPSKMITNVQQMFKAKLKDKGIYLQIDLPDLPVFVRGDKYKLTLVLINILSNSIKFTHSGGITISLRHHITDDDVTLQFSVKDTGIGINPQELNTLFQPFSQANGSIFSKYGGSGLGLQLCKKLVNLMGGDIKLESSGVGSTCTFHVACKKSETEDEMSTSNSSDDDVANHLPERNTEKKKRILIVEDNPINQKLLQRILKTENYPTESANNGKEAVEKVISSANTENAFQVVLMDLEMPIMNGMEATKKVREFEKENPKVDPLIIIGVSANAREGHQKGATDIGMNSYVTKPFQKRDIIAAIEQK